MVITRSKVKLNKFIINRLFITKILFNNLAKKRKEKKEKNKLTYVYLKQNVIFWREKEKELDKEI